MLSRLGGSSPGTEDDFVRGSPEIATSCRREIATRFGDLRPAGDWRCSTSSYPGLWLVPDSFPGCMATRWPLGIVERSRHLGMGRISGFSPVSPLTGTGSPFLPNLPWLNPGALALAIPASLPMQHLASMLIYLAELSASLYWLYRHLEFSREQSLSRDDPCISAYSSFHSADIRWPCPGSRSRHKRPFDRRDECGDRRLDPSRVRAARLQVAFRVSCSSPPCSLASRRRLSPR